MITIVVGAGRGAGHQAPLENARLWFLFAAGSPCRECRHLGTSRGIES